MDRAKWVDRKFTFDFPEGWMANILERLRGTASRIEEITAGLSEEKLAKKNGAAWSMKEHIGHLGDLDELHDGRIDDFLERKDVLRPADMTNKKTNDAHHNTRSLEELLQEFRTKRIALVRRFESLDDQTQRFRSLHPRLKIMMRPVDSAFFTAEHDDHHLATIRELVQ